MTGHDAAALEQAILSAWHDNARPWTRAVREGSIASRRLVTDAAIVAAVRSYSPRSVIDLGCGEGWLMRALAGEGIEVLGVDAVPELVAQAGAGAGRAVLLDYPAIAAGALAERADVVVCNFSLIGEASVAAVLGAVPTLLQPGGVLLIQTLHPWAACGHLPYRDGWREGTWDGCGEGFGEAAPWYFRTLQGWLETCGEAGLRLIQLHEPQHPQTGRPASLVLALRVAHPAG